jgi:hypothetical protein
MKARFMTTLLRNRELGCFTVCGFFVGVLLNVALHARPYDLGGISGGVLSSIMIYFLA